MMVSARLRSRVIESVDVLQISIPVRKVWGVVAFATFWLGFSLVFFLAAGIDALTSHHDQGEGLWWWFPLLWIVPSLWMLSLWLWNVFGRDVLTVRDGVLTVTKRMPFFRHTRVFRGDEVRSLHASALLSAPRSIWQPRSPGAEWGLTGGRVTFDYGGKSYRYGTGISEQEAQQLVALLLARLGGERAAAPAEGALPPVVESGGIVEVTLRPTRPGALFTFFAFWLGLNLVTVPIMLASGRDDFLSPPGMPAPLRAIWAVFLGLFFMAVLLWDYAWLWGRFGREVVTIADGTLAIARESPLSRRRRSFDLGRVQRLRLEPERSWRAQYGASLGFGGLLAFDYERRTYHFAAVGETEARQLLAQLAARFPSLGSPSRS